jgi:aspartyl-tRNA synthetase
MSKTAYRTHTCGELRGKDKGKKVKLCGWVDTIREHGKLAFVDLRDRYGKTQVVLTEGKGSGLKPEFVIQIEGEVKERKKGSENKDLDTGDVEVKGDKIEILNESPVLPFELGDDKVGEDVRMINRYLDLRSEKLQGNLVLRSIKQFMNILMLMDLLILILLFWLRALLKGQEII